MEGRYVEETREGNIPGCRSACCTNVTLVHFMNSPPIALMQAAKTNADADHGALAGYMGIQQTAETV